MSTILKVTSLVLPSIVTSIFELFVVFSTSAATSALTSNVFVLPVISKVVSLESPSTFESTSLVLPVISSSVVVLLPVSCISILLPVPVVIEVKVLELPVSPALSLTAPNLLVDPSCLIVKVPEPPDWSR